MNTLITALEKYFDGYNKVKKVIIPRSKLVNREEAIDILENVYYQNYRSFSEYYNLGNMRDRFDNIGLEWTNHSGRFLSRLIRALPEFSDFSGILGDRITRRAYQNHDSKWLLSISSEIFWHDGEFGKDDSCWWGCYKESREVFTEDANGIALLWHDNYDAYSGIGRVWIAPLRERINNQWSDLLFLFNQYGEVNGRTIRIEETGKLLSSIIPDTKFISGRLYNDSDENIPYINGNSGIYISSADIEDGLSIHVEWGEDRRQTCYECDDYIDDGDEFTYRDRTYCESCYDDNFSSCARCGNTEYQGNMTYIESESSDYCEYCVRNYFTLCDNCNEYFSNDNIYNNLNNWYCETCRNDFTQCEDCEEYFPNDDVTELDGLFYCNDCNAQQEETVTVLINDLMDF